MIFSSYCLANSPINRSRPKTGCGGIAQHPSGYYYSGNYYQGNGVNTNGWYRVGNVIINGRRWGDAGYRYSHGDLIRW